MSKKEKSHDVDLDLEIGDGKVLKNFIVNISDFDVIKTLGQGSFGTVHLVREKSTGKKYASKALKYDIYDEKSKKLFKSEVEILAKYGDYYSLLGFRGFTEFKEGSIPHIFTEYCENLELTKIILLETSGMAPHQYDDTQKFIIAYGIACGMQFLHKNKIVHRDIKPENIFLTDLLEPKIADFGLSKQIKGTPYQSEVVGTPLFMAPEIFDDDQKYSFPVDVYAYGMVLYNIFTQETPFYAYADANIMQISKLVQKGERPKFPADIPSYYKDLIIECWAQEPEKRPTFDIIVQKLDQIVNDIPDIYLELVDDYKDNLLQKEAVHRNNDSNRARRKVKKQLTIKQKLKKEAEDGDAVSQLNLANRYLKGDGVRQNSQKAVKYFKKAAKNGEVRAMVKLGNCLQEGKGTGTPDYEKAVEWFKRAIDEGNDENAMYYYSQLLFEGKGEIKNVAKAVKLLKAAAELNQTDAEYKYGMMLEFGTNGIEKNTEEAVKYYKLSSDHGNEVGMFNYADVLEKGKYVDKDLKEAARLFRLSYKRGYAPAICRYGEMLLEGKGVGVDIDEARRLFLLAIENNYTSAYVSLGQMYLTGKGFVKNEKEATRLFKMAADAGNVRGMIQYGISLEEGIGCKKDVVKALDLYEKSIKKGSKIALTKAAKLLLLGEDGVDENLDKAIDYLTTAKENGDDEAASILDDLMDG